MGTPNKAGKIGSILSAVLISIGVLTCGVSLLLPSTKRARIHFQQLDDTATTPTTASTTPATAPTTQP